MKNYEELIRERRSVRSFDGTGLSAEEKEKLMAFAGKAENPYGIPVKFLLLDAKQHDLKSPVITGTDLYIGGKIKKEPHAEEAFGYSLEMLVLFAQSLGIGTTWIGGTMDRAAFENAMELENDERMPCVTPVGYPAKKMSMREKMMRKGVRADWREDFETVFFDGDFSIPLKKEKSGRLAEILEAVRH